MGNCQAAQVATVVVLHPGNGKVERMHWAIAANEVMSSNPGHYVALVVDTSSNVSDNALPSGAAKHQLKLLRPTDILHVGHVYHLITFEDVIKEFSTKKSVKLGKLLKQSGVLSVDKNNKSNAGSALDQTQIEKEGHGPGRSMNRGAGSRHVGRHHGSGGQWKPVLQSIAEIAS